MYILRNEDNVIRKKLDVDVFVEKIINLVNKLLCNKSYTIGPCLIKGFISIVVYIKILEIDEINISVSIDWTDWKAVYVHVPENWYNSENVNYIQLIEKLYEKLNNEYFSKSKFSKEDIIELINKLNENIL